MSPTRCAAVLVSLVVLASSQARAQDAAPNQPKTYYIILIKGEIGRHFTAARMEAALKEAERLNPSVVVLEMDTGGGDIYDAERIVDLIIAHKQLRFVAFVRNALSAGATITLACEKIFVVESATIGGAVSYSIGTDGRPQSRAADPLIAEKFQSMWRAVCRKAAEHGGHPSLIAEAMADSDFALTMREQEGKPVFERDGQGKMLKAKGRILTLTARETVDCKLAEALVPDLKAVGRHLGMPEWQEIGGRQGVQPADAASSERSASDPFATPDSLYRMLYEKVVSLGLTGQLTQIQEKKVLEDWTAWFRAQHLAGRRIEWTITLVGASEGELRLVPDLSDLTEGERVWVLSTGSLPVDKKLVLAGSVRGPRMMLDEFRKLLADATSELKQQRQKLAKDRNDESARNSASEYSKRVAYIARLLQETEAYPVKVTAKCDNEPRVFLVAWVSRRSKDALAGVAPENEIALSGKIGEVVPYLSQDGIFVIEVILDQCELPQEGSAGTSDCDKDAERKCKEWLSMARNYICAGTPVKAIPYLKQVIEQYGDTEYVKEARKLEQEALGLIGGQPEGEGAPPTEGVASPELEDKKQ